MTVSKKLTGLEKAYTMKGDTHMKKNYTLESIEALIAKYVDMGGDVYTLKEGTLGLGLTVCTLDGYKSAVITEYYISDWASGHTCRLYNKLPKKYQKMIDEADWAEVKPIWAW